MQEPATRRVWATITIDQLEALYRLIEEQKGQLVLALGVLSAIGFDLADFTDLMP